MAVDSPPAAAAKANPVALSDGRLLDHLASAAAMVGGRRFREAEVEVLRGLSIVPSDLRALKLLALVRFKLGRLEEARAVCREIAATLPRDAGIRLKLGLIALKLERIDESVHELELAARLGPADARAWSYLGFAYARQGERARAAAAFRRAGQEDHATEAERGLLVGPAAQVPDDLLAAEPEWQEKGGDAAAAAVAVPSTTFDWLAPVDARASRLGDPTPATTSSERRAPTLPPRTGADTAQVTPLGAFAVSRLAPATEQAAWVGGTLRLVVADRVYVRRDAAVACAGTVSWADAHRHTRGRASTELLGAGGDAGAPGAFLLVQGSGEVFVAAPVGHLLPLSLDDDTLYVREDRVLAFEGTLAWESGAIPRAGVRMLQFRGRGLVALAVAGEPGAVRVTPQRPVFASVAAVLGWVGGVVAVGTGPAGPDTDGGLPPVGGGPFAIACEGEGVVLMDVAPGSDKEGP
jgi:uncharacterized protein (AIM24 family)